VAVVGAGERIRKAVLRWPGVTGQPHRFGGLEYRVGRREIGHVHGDSLVDIPFPRRVRDELVAAGQARLHHVLPESGWVSVPLARSADVEGAIALLRLSYEAAMRRRVTNPDEPPVSPEDP
jgi:hypothetical protein